MSIFRYLSTLVFLIGYGFPWYANPIITLYHSSSSGWKQIITNFEYVMALFLCFQYTWNYMSKYYTPNTSKPRNIFIRMHQQLCKELYSWWIFKYYILFCLILWKVQIHWSIQIIFRIRSYMISIHCCVLLHLVALFNRIDSLYINVPKPPTFQ